jgi:serine/threonine protein kinase
MWCCCPILLNESPNSSIYQYNNTIKKVIHGKEFYDRELSALKKLSHPYIISIERVHRSSIVMKYYPRGDMYYYINKGLPEYVVQHYAKQLIEALVHCHSCGVSHRDVKLDNLLLTDEWNIKLCDFGLSTTKEIEDTYCGTADYAPPEVLAHIPYNPMLADTWSYGVTVYAMLMAMLPWNGWSGSVQGREFIEICLQKKRPYLYKIKGHPWLKYGEVISYMSKIEID